MNDDADSSETTTLRIGPGGLEDIEITPGRGARLELTPEATTRLEREFSDRVARRLAARGRVTE